MSRLMSVSHTAAAVVARQKTVTRRVGWLMLRPGERLTLCEKVMGRKPGEPLVRLAEVEVLSVCRERLDAITDADVMREGFPGSTSEAFLAFYTGTFRVPRDHVVTRIEWRYLEEADDATREFFDHARRDLAPKVASSAAVISINPGARPEDIDPKLAIETGYAVLLGKPIVVVTADHRPLNRGLRRLAARVVELEGPLESMANQLALQAALRDVIAEEGS